MAHPKRPELKLEGNISENFKNYELRFNDYCIQAGHRDLTKSASTEKDDHYKNKIQELAALRSSLPDEALSVVRYKIEPEIATTDKEKPWIWMEKLKIHYTGASGSALLPDRFKFWHITQKPHESIQEWEVRIRQASSLCEYADWQDTNNRDNFIFGLNSSAFRSELSKTHLRSDGTPKTMYDVVAEAKALEAANMTNKIIGDATRTEEQVNWTNRTTQPGTQRKLHRDMKLKREPGTCFYCGDQRGSHPWRDCPAKDKTCSKCKGHDHFARVCEEISDPRTQRQTGPTRRGRGRHFGGRGQQRGRPQYNNNPVHSLNTEQDTDFQETDQDYQEGYQCYSLASKKGKRYLTTLPISSTGNIFTNMTFQIDTGASCNTMSETTFSKLPETLLKRSPYLLHPYGDAKPLTPIGQTQLLCDKGDKFTTLNFQILPDAIMGDKPALLSGSDSERLGLIKIRADEVFTITSVINTATNTNTDHPPGYQIHTDKHGKQGKTLTSGPNPSSPIKIPAERKLPPPGQLEKHHITTQYKTTFEGLGYLGPPVSFKLDHDITPVQMPVHRIPLAKRSKEKEALDRYTDLGIIAKVHDPTQWCSNEHIKETPKKFRICIDPSQTINKAINRPVFQMPTLQEHLHRLGNAKCFSLADVRDGFLHVPLDESSSLLTTMHTSYGRYRWLRLPFGVSSAPEEFQMRLLTALEGLEGVVCIADDILIYGEGATYEDATKDHDRRIIALLERCTQKNIKLNAEKLKFKVKEVKFMGNIVTTTGMRADPEKITAITEMTPPKDKAALQRFIGMINYLSPYCENLSTVIQPLRALVREGMSFDWSSTHQTAFDKAKNLITCAPTLLYYDPSKPVLLQVDASEKGLGGALMQPNTTGDYQPVAFTSCSLTETEQRYSQIEKECLAICNGLNKFDQWLYGKHDITIHTDHKPLETILKKPLNKAPARLQRMMTRLQRYPTITVEYRKGTSLHLADTLSRAFLPTPTGTKTTDFEVFRIDMETTDPTETQRITPHTDNALRHATTSDTSLNKLYELIVTGWPENRNEVPESVRQYWNFRDELSVQNGLIYKGEATLVPQAMITDILEKIHLNHSGAESAIRMAKEVLFWPGMRKMIQNMCDTCSTCAQYNSSAPKEPMQSLPIPTLPWQLVSQDLFEYEKKHYLVTVCHFSDWIEVDRLDNTLSRTIVEKSKAHFSRYGIPSTCHTDNGPQFISKDFKDFARTYNFNHTTSSPYHPQGNGRAEAAVKVAKTLLKKATDFQAALLNYRNTPQQGHTYSPAQRMLSRRTRTLLPTSDRLLSPKPIPSEVVIKETDKKKRCSKAYYDKTAGPPLTPLRVGDYAYSKPRPEQRGQPWQYGEITAKQDRSYTIETPISKIRRNRRDIKLAAAPPPNWTMQTHPQHRSLITHDQQYAYLSKPETSPPKPQTTNANAIQTPNIDQTRPTTNQNPKPDPQTPVRIATTSPTPRQLNLQTGTTKDSPHPPDRLAMSRKVKLPAKYKDFDMG